MEYLILFNEAGHRKETVAEKIHYKTEEQRQSYIDNGFVPVTEEEYAYYVGNKGMGEHGTGYIRDTETGKPISAPPHVPSKDEQAQVLYNACQSDLRQIDAQIVSAVAMGDDELAVDLRKDRAERIEQYQHDLAELEGGDE